MAGEFRTNLKDVTGQSEFDASAPGALPNAFSNVSDPRNQNEVLLGLGGNIDSVQDRGKALAKHNEAVRKRAEQGRKSTSDAVFLDLMDRARETSDRLGREIADMEAQFESEFGDAWREHIANVVLAPDDIPQRHEGESLVEYRKRVEQALIDEYLDDAGNIKPEHRGDRYAIWAKNKYDKREVDAALDPSLSREQQEARLTRLAEKGSLDQVSDSRERLDAEGRGHEALDKAADDVVDTALSQDESSSELSAFKSGF